LNTHTHTHTHIHTYIHTYTHTHTHTYIHTYVHIHIHTYAILRNVGICVPNNTASHHNTAIFSKLFFYRESCLQASLLDLVEIRFKSWLEHVTGCTWFFVVFSPGKYWNSTRALYDLPTRFHSSLRLFRVTSGSAALAATPDGLELGSTRFF
jgi:hypothetical protein